MSDARRWAPSVLWGVGILVATSLPGSALPIAPAIPHLDKLVHAGLYGVLGVLVARALHASIRATTVVACGAIAAFAMADEWHQQWIPGRSADALDWLADVAGATLGFTLSRSAQQRRETRT